MHNSIVCELNHSRRRPREEVEDLNAYGASSFGEHRNKRIITGPLGSSTKQFPSFPPTTNGFCETLNPSYAAQQGQSHQFEIAHHPEHPHAAVSDDTSMDMDMTHPPDPASGLAPPVADRVPTPIQPSFMTQVRGSSWAEAPETEVGRPNGVNNLGHQPTPPADAIPRTMAADVEWSAVRNRRLPSPISEAEDTQSGTTPDTIDGTFTTNLAARLASQVSITTPGERLGNPTDEAPCAKHEGEPTTPSPGRKGHTRSKHTINSWTHDPGMKKTFSMGYRTDCEKCRLKVPGHFNHIIIS
ncbi:uncharacterized protein DNG_10204 [Cephalotrichum gorgonifer]|uniref:Uncharacterized protein n=1 Tax=Cephalotrichum gorgonifer TaxID=2041049 RepID=A0AAE8N9B5_9PEZI|nr:uncharacterized protein DNG_10204 [Cephalotrichum gorgonifer]